MSYNRYLKKIWLTMNQNIAQIESDMSRKYTGNGLKIAGIILKDGKYIILLLFSLYFPFTDHYFILSKFP